MKKRCDKLGKNIESHSSKVISTAQKMKSSIKELFSKFD